MVQVLVLFFRYLMYSRVPDKSKANTHTVTIQIKLERKWPAETKNTDMSVFCDFQNPADITIMNYRPYRPDTDLKHSLVLILVHENHALPTHLALVNALNLMKYIWYVYNITRFRKLNFWTLYEKLWRFTGTIILRKKLNFSSKVFKFM